MYNYFLFYCRHFSSIIKDNPIVKLFYHKNNNLDKKLDGNGIPLVYYSDIYNGKPIGFQRNPVTVAAQAEIFYHLYDKNNFDEISKTYFLNNADWLVNNLVKKGNWSVYKYPFPLQIYNLKPQWTSAMANGQSLQVMIHANKMTNDTKYLCVAKSMLNAFFVSVHDGGITYKDSDRRWWYEEY